MISGERSANWASSFLRSAGASWAAAALRWMTRPARSSSTAGSGMPATTALTAAASTGLTPRTSSREVAASCSRHGTSAAAAMQTNTAQARTSDNSPSATTTLSASAAASRISAAWRNRSGHGENMEGGESSIAIAAAFFPSVHGSRRRSRIDLVLTSRLAASSDARVTALANKNRFMVRLGAGTRISLRQPFQTGSEDNFPKRQQDYRYDEWGNIVEQPEQQHAAEQVLAVHLPEADQHGGIEHPETAGGVAGEAEQGRRHEDDGDHDKAQIWLVRHQHVHRQCAEAEVDDTDRDLQQRQRPARQGHRPGAAADHPGLGPDPDHIGNQRDDDPERQGAIEPGRQLVDVGGGLRVIGDAEPEHRGIAEPEGETGEEADLGDVDRVQPPGRIDPVAHRAAGEDAGADIVADRIGGERCKRVDAVRHMGVADRANREQIIEGQGEIARRHEQRRQPDLARLGR